MVAGDIVHFIIHFWFKYLSDHVTAREAVMNVPLCNDLQDNPFPASWIRADWGVAEYIGEICKGNMSSR